MIWIISIISVLGIVAGIYSLTKGKKTIGIVELLLVLICSYITVAFGNLQSSHAFGGTKFEYFVSSASDGCIEPWILLFLIIIEIICIITTVCMFLKETKK